MQIHHAAFRTHDLSRLCAFYTDVLGFRETRRDAERSVWLSAGDAILMLERASDGEPKDLSASMELVAFKVTREERDALRAKLVAARITPDGETDFTTYVRDPDRRRIGFSHYPDR
jgi:catechol 2,3-dioxygenase-like lactoylglutathione lyase family enzyme